MKIIHCADLHLDAQMESNLDREKAALRRRELLATFEKLVSYAEAEGVRVILIAGDLFDKPHIRKEARQRVWEQIRTHPEIDFCYLRGNHDRCDFLGATEELPKNLKLFFHDDWVSYDYGEAVITGMELNQHNARTLGMNLVLDQNRCNIVVLHGQESDYEGGDKAEIVHIGALKNKGIDYLALGHIHSYKKQILDERGEYCYCGCLEGRGFDECGEKGFVLLNIEKGEVQSKFVPFSKRKLHEVTCPVTPEMDMPVILEHVKKAVSQISSEDLVKIIMTGTTEIDCRIDMERILESLEQSFFFVKGYDRTQVAVHYENFLHDRSLKGEFVRLMQEQELPEEQKGAIIELGLQAIMGEEI